MERYITSREYYYDPELEKEIAKLEKELMAYAELKGEEDGIINKPISTTEYIVAMHNKVAASVQNVIDKNQERNQPAAAFISVRERNEIANGSILHLKSDVRDLLYKRGDLKAERDSLKQGLKPGWMARIEPAIAVGLGLFEGVLFYEACKAGGMGTLLTYGFPVLISTVATSGVHLSAKYIKEAKTTKEAKKRILRVLAGGLIFPLALSWFRADIYSKIINVGISTSNNIQAVPNTSTGTFLMAFISFVVFVIALMLAVNYWKTDEEKKREAAFRDKCREIAELDKEKVEKENKVEALNTEVLTESSIAKHRLEYAISVEYRLMSLAKMVQQKYIEKNLRYRTDDVIPDFFSTPLPFVFKTFFDKINKN